MKTVSSITVATLATTSLATAQYIRGGSSGANAVSSPNELQNLVRQRMTAELAASNEEEPQQMTAEVASDRVLIRKLPFQKGSSSAAASQRDLMVKLCTPADPCRVRDLVELLSDSPVPQDDSALDFDPRLLEMQYGPDHPIAFDEDSDVDLTMVENETNRHLSTVDTNISPDKDSLWILPGDRAVQLVTDGKEKNRHLSVLPPCPGDPVPSYTGIC